MYGVVKTTVIIEFKIILYLNIIQRWSKFYVLEEGMKERAREMEKLCEYFVEWFLFF